MGYRNLVVLLTFKQVQEEKYLVSKQQSLNDTHVFNIDIFKLTQFFFKRHNK